MNYFPFHVGDYAAHTAHLEPMEDLAYRRMLDAYYLREGPLPADVGEVARLIRMRAFTTEIDVVLAEFFDKAPEGWRHTRCDEEISKMQDKQTKARASAAASVNARRTSAQRTLNERSADVQLPTPTPTPTPKGEGSPDLLSGVEAPIADPAVATVPLNDGTEYGVSQKQVDEWSIAYPRVDIVGELARVRSWCNANRANRKTKRGVDAFLVRWLSKAQDQGGSSRSTGRQSTGDWTENAS